MKVDLVLQGPCSRPTKEIIEQYRNLEFVDSIILSTYANTICFDIPSYVTVIDNPIPENFNRGIGNRNLQIKTSRSGLRFVSGKHCVKMRTDQLIRENSMRMMHDYWMKNKNSEGLLFVLGMYRYFPYHPRDHVFWGDTKRVSEIFEIPYDTVVEQPGFSYDNHLRAETYIGQFYYAKFDDQVYDHIANPGRFLVDSAPEKELALQKDFHMRDYVFKPFPRISMCWEKHGLNEYHYDVGASFSEYWAD